jgi:P27 family predicted phage terminase small subunit
VAARPGPKPLPSNVVALRGNAGKRARPSEAKPKPIAPAAPAWLTELAVEVWKHHAPELERLGLLTALDREAFAFACTDAAAAVEALESMTVIEKVGRKTRRRLVLIDVDPGHEGRLRRHPAWIVYRQAAEGYARWCARFGLTPSDRVGLGGDEGGDGADANADLYDT